MQPPLIRLLSNQIHLIIKINLLPNNESIPKSLCDGVTCQQGAFTSHRHLTMFHFIIMEIIDTYNLQVIDITSFEKHLESSLDHTLNFCRNLVIFRSKNICQKESLTRSSTVI